MCESRPWVGGGMAGGSRGKSRYVMAGTGKEQSQANSKQQRQSVVSKKRIIIVIPPHSGVCISRLTVCLSCSSVLPSYRGDLNARMRRKMRC